MNDETKAVLTNCLDLFKRLKHSADSKHSSNLSTLGVDLIEAVLNPKPKYEEIEVVGYALIDKNGVRQATSNEPFMIKESCMFDFTEVKLTGTYQKEVKPKVKRREFFGEIAEAGLIQMLALERHQGAILFAEWEEDAE